MTFKLKKDDIDLLKGYFSSENSNLISKHAETRVTLLEKFKENPSGYSSFIYPFAGALIILVLSIIITQLSNDYMKAQISLAITNFPNNVLLGGIPVLIVILILFSLLYVLIKSIRNELVALDERPLLFEFMIILKKDEGTADELRRFLKENAQKPKFPWLNFIKFPKTNRKDPT